MFKRGFKALLILAAILGVDSESSLLHAEQSSGIGAQNVHLNFAVNVPQVLLLRIGSTGAVIDTVTFEPPLIPTGAWINAASGGTQIVQISGLVPPTTTIRLTADSSIPLSSGSFTIPFSRIRTNGSGAFASVSALAFNGATDQEIWSTTGAGMRQGNFSYQYHNTAPSLPGAYGGQITYTLSTP